MEAKLDSDRAKSLYRQMLLIRRFEEEAARAYSQGKIGGFLHLYIGQEAVAVGTMAVAEKDDYALTSYRDHGLALACGTPARACMAELYGKDTGCSRGLGGSMHMFDVSNNFLGGHAIVGGHVALGAGVGFKCRYLKEKRVSISFFGEGATNIGGFHEALSLASLWKLPCVFICENNEYAMGTPSHRSSAVTDMSQKAVAYGMASERVEDGHELTKVMEAIERAMKRARAGEGPTFVEVLTYRFRGHSMSDPGKYRTPEEVSDRKKTKDPVLRGQELLQDEFDVKDEEIESISDSVEEEVKDAVEFAETSEPAKSELIDRFIYAQKETGSDEESA